MSAITVEEADAIQPAQARMSPPSPFGDKAFYWLTLSMAFAVVLLVILIGWELGQGSWQAIQKFGFHFLTTSKWDPVAEEFGALPFIYGTVVSSLIALLIAVPLSIATAVYLTELALLSYARKGLFGEVILGLGRALGETMAVTIVIGNTPQIAASLFKPGYTLASVIANEFTEATTDMYLQALFEIGLVLFGVTILVNLLAQQLLRTIATKSATRAVQ